MKTVLRAEANLIGEKTFEVKLSRVLVTDSGEDAPAKPRVVLHANLTPSEAKTYAGALGEAARRLKTLVDQYEASR